MPLYKYSVQIGLGTTRKEGFSENLSLANNHAWKYSKVMTSLIVIVTEHGRNDILAAFEEGESIPVARAEIIARVGYTPEAKAAWAAHQGAGKES